MIRAIPGGGAFAGLFLQTNLRLAWRVSTCALLMDVIEDSKDVGNGMYSSKRLDRYFDGKELLFCKVVRNEVLGR